MNTQTISSTANHLSVQALKSPQHSFIDPQLQKFGSNLQISLASLSSNKQQEIKKTNGTSTPSSNATQTTRESPFLTPCLVPINPEGPEHFHQEDHTFNISDQVPRANLNLEEQSFNGQQDFSFQKQSFRSGASQNGSKISNPSQPSSLFSQMQYPFEYQISQDDIQRERQLVEGIKSLLNGKIEQLKQYLVEVTPFRVKYFEMMILDITREKDREIGYISQLVEKRLWNPADTRSIDSLQRKIRDIWIEMHDLKDLQSMETASRLPSIYYNPFRASRQLQSLTSLLRRSGSASQLHSFSQSNIESRAPSTSEFPKFVEERNPQYRTPFNDSRPLRTQPPTPEGSQKNIPIDLSDKKILSTLYIENNYHLSQSQEVFLNGQSKQSFINSYYPSNVQLNDHQIAQSFHENRNLKLNSVIEEPFFRSNNSDSDNKNRISPQMEDNYYANCQKSNISTSALIMNGSFHQLIQDQNEQNRLADHLQRSQKEIGTGNGQPINASALSSTIKSQQNGQLRKDPNEIISSKVQIVPLTVSYGQKSQCVEASVQTSISIERSACYSNQNFYNQQSQKLGASMNNQQTPDNLKSSDIKLASSIQCQQQNQQIHFGSPTSQLNETYFMKTSPSINNHQINCSSYIQEDANERHSISQQQLESSTQSQQNKNQLNNSHLQQQPQQFTVYNDKPPSILINRNTIVDRRKNASQLQGDNYQKNNCPPYIANQVNNQQMEFLSANQNHFASQQIPPKNSVSFNHPSYPQERLIRSEFMNHSFSNMPEENHNILVTSTPHLDQQKQDPSFEREKKDWMTQQTSSSQKQGESHQQDLERMNQSQSSNGSSHSNKEEQLQRSVGLNQQPRMKESNISSRYSQHDDEEQQNIENSEKEKENESSQVLNPKNHSPFSTVSTNLTTEKHSSDVKFLKDRRQEGEFSRQCLSNSCQKDSGDNIIENETSSFEELVKRSPIQYCSCPPNIANQNRGGPQCRNCNKPKYDSELNTNQGDSKRGSLKIDTENQAPCLQSPTSIFHNKSNPFSALSFNNNSLLMPPIQHGFGTMTLGQSHISVNQGECTYGSEIDLHLFSSKKNGMMKSGREEDDQTKNVKEIHHFGFNQKDSTAWNKSGGIQNSSSNFLSTSNQRKEDSYCYSQDSISMDPKSKSGLMPNSQRELSSFSIDQDISEHKWGREPNKMQTICEVVEQQQGVLSQSSESAEGVSKSDFHSQKENLRNESNSIQGSIKSEKDLRDSHLSSSQVSNKQSKLLKNIQGEIFIGQVQVTIVQSEEEYDEFLKHKMLQDQETQNDICEVIYKVSDKELQLRLIQEQDNSQEKNNALFDCFPVSQIISNLIEIVFTPPNKEPALQIVRQISPQEGIVFVLFQDNSSVDLQTKQLNLEALRRKLFLVLASQEEKQEEQVLNILRIPYNQPYNLQMMPPNFTLNQEYHNDGLDHNQISPSSQKFVYQEVSHQFCNGQERNPKNREVDCQQSDSQMYETKKRRDICYKCQESNISSMNNEVHSCNQPNFEEHDLKQPNYTSNVEYRENNNNQDSFHNSLVNQSIMERLRNTKDLMNDIPEESSENTKDRNCQENSFNKRQNTSEILESSSRRSHKNSEIESQRDEEEEEESKQYEQAMIEQMQQRARQSQEKVSIGDFQEEQPSSYKSQIRQQQENKNQNFRKNIDQQLLSSIQKVNDEEDDEIIKQAQSQINEFSTDQQREKSFYNQPWPANESIQRLRDIQSAGKSLRESQQHFFIKCRYQVFTSRTQEEEEIVTFFKKFDDKEFLMKKYGQNTSSSQMRRVFFSSDFRFLCWKNPNKPDIKKIFPIYMIQNYILHGRQTNNFKRFKNAKQTEIDCSFSLVLENRTIDLEALSLQDKEFFISGLQLIFRAFE